jgi:hypothetical protein
MCLVKTPKTVSAQQQADAKKDPAILRNPYLDGINPLILSRQKGLASLRIDRQPQLVSAASPLVMSRP